jgi:DNA-binding MarR family transcriptional regulator
MRDVAARLDDAKTSVTYAVDSLVEAGLVERARAATDRRLVRLMLTEAGEALLRRIDAAGRASARGDAD